MRFTAIGAVALVLNVLSPAALDDAAPVASQDAVQGAPRLKTRWADAVTPESVHREYPRPQMAREHWLCLNGAWQFAEAQADDEPPVGRPLPQTILVPFPPESLLSGIARPVERAWYRRTFEVPKGLAWKDNRVLLNFEAVDWEAVVFVNGRKVGEHRGGYDPFTFDITEALLPGGPQELIVGVHDPSDAGDQPRGKQVRRPEGIWYTPTTGIWGTVWLEPVPAMHITGLRIRTDAGQGVVCVTATAAGTDDDSWVHIVVTVPGRTVGHMRGKPNEELRIRVENARRWSPESPYLYSLRASVGRGAMPHDAVESYFGMREVAIGPDEQGVTRILLNGKPYFQMGPLDQGFWPDGLYTAPSDEALRYDVEMTKKLGFNMTRKHVKVEPRRWYYWADKLGLLVWQDMPSGNNTTPESRRQFEHELTRMIETHRNSPAIIMWVVFNEGWGQHDTERLTARVKQLDPTRLVSNASGWTDKNCGDVLDYHAYPAPVAPQPSATRAAVVGEFGGLGLAVAGHRWRDEHWGYQGVGDGDELTMQYELLLRQIHEQKERPGISAAVYTQLADVELECNGLLTYDRAVVKGDAERIAAANRGDFSRAARLEPVVAAADAGEAATWAYTLEAPAGADWLGPGFDDAGWKRGPAGFGTRGTPGARIGTEWSSAEIWLRREFELPAEAAANGAALRLWIHHDEDAEVYINGAPAAKLTGYATAYRVLPIAAEALSRLKPGRNVLAIHCRQTTGGQYIDAGLVRISLPPAP
ncbi:MAG: glycoside hydrolase family 2 [Phycisphaerae bacterium]|nr:glycoside hydrolase family 2 [Phycisphaerae bacterium]MCZ2399472.1 glycoside hydrolase family 2 [Phycisphaerae bacterium]